MPTNISKIYDTIVIGAGIAGSSAAFALAQRGECVLLIDRSSVPASGGSGAAGAFVSPKIGKGGPLQQLTNEAFAYAHEFYSTHFPEHFEQSGVVRIPRDDTDAEKFHLYEPHNYPNYEIWDAKKLAVHGITDRNSGFFFPEAGNCDAPAMCRALADEVEFMQFDVGRLERVDGIWEIRRREELGVSSEELGIRNEEAGGRSKQRAVSSVGRGVLTPTNSGSDRIQGSGFMAQEARSSSHPKNTQEAVDSSEISAPNKFGVPKNISTHYPLPITHNGVRPADDKSLRDISQITYQRYQRGQVIHDSSLRDKSHSRGQVIHDSSLRDKSQITRPLLAHNVVLATGYQNDLVDMRYMGIKGLWGSRGDFVTEEDFPVSLHKTISISSTRDGIVKIGATHNKAPNPCMVCDGNPLAPLINKASELVDIGDFRLKETFCGMRSGSRDYFPTVGRVVDTEAMLEQYPNIVRGAKPDLKHLPGIYSLNGLGGRGFVWAPLMAKWLSELMVDKIPISSKVDPDRMFYKWARKMNR